MYRALLDIDIIKCQLMIDFQLISQLVYLLIIALVGLTLGCMDVVLANTLRASRVRVTDLDSLLGQLARAESQTEVLSSPRVASTLHAACFQVAQILLIYYSHFARKI